MPQSRNHNVRVLKKPMIVSSCITRLRWLTCTSSLQAKTERVGNAHELPMPQLQNHNVRVLKHSIVVSSCLTKAAMAHLHQQLVDNG